MIGEGLVFGYDTGFPMISQSLDNTYLYNNGVPAKNIARVMTSWPTKARASVATYSGDIEPPIPGEAIYKLTCNADNAGILIRDGGLYYGGGFAGTGNAQNTDILSDRTNSYTPAGNNKFIYSLYVRPTNNTLSNTSANIDIGDRGTVGKSNVENLTDWHKLVCNDSLGINNQYPYDFFDLNFAPNTIGNEILVSAIQIIRTPGTDSGSLQTPSQFPQHLTYGAERTFTNSLLDLTGNHTIDATNISFAGDSLIDFDGTDDYLEVADSSALDLTSAMSFEFIVKAESSQSNPFPRLIDKSNYLIHISQTSPFTIAMNITVTGGTLRQTAIGTAFTANKYAHIVCTYDGQFGKIYVNGEGLFERNFSSSANCSTNNTSLKFGGNGTTSRVLNGQLPITRVYNRVLTDGEIEQNFTALRGRFNI